MSTCGEAGSDVHALIKEPVIRRVEHMSEIHSKESPHLAEGTEVGRLRQQFSMCLTADPFISHAPPSLQTGVALARTRQLRSEGPVSIHAHRIEG